MNTFRLPLGYYDMFWMVSDREEVMFLRGVAYAAEAETGGLVPTAVLHWLTRAPRTAAKTAQVLAEAGLWTKVEAGFQIPNWDLWRDRRLNRDRIPLAVRLAVYERDGHQCRLCGATEPLSLDHIFPWSLGGSDDPENLQTLCLPCNMRKGARVS